MNVELAALKPMQYNPMERTQIIAGVGVYREKSAMALGVAHYKNKSTMFNAGVAWANGSDGHLMANAGVTWKIGNLSGEDKVPARYKADPISSIYVMQDEVTALQDKNAQLEAKNASLEADVETLKAQVAALLAR